MSGYALKTSLVILSSINFIVLVCCFISLLNTLLIVGMLRYEKMKAVADGKQRNSSGKFVKKIKPLANGDENLALEAPHTEQAEPVVQKHQMESHEERQHEDQDNEQQKDKEENVQDANAEGNDE